MNKQELVTRDEHAAQQQPSFSFEQMQRMAVSIAKSGIFGIKDPDQAIALMLIAHSEGRHPASVARDFDIIQGRPAKKSEAILRDFQASGGRVEWHQRDDQAAIATFTHPLAVKPMKIEWTLERAKTAGLTDKNGGMYTKYRRQMLSARCISEGCRATAPQATSGFYTPEEVRQFEADDPTPVSVTAAIEQATAAALSDEEVNALIEAMDVPSLTLLEAAFANAWRATKDPKVRLRFKEVYDGMKVEIERVAMEEARQ